MTISVNWDNQQQTILRYCFEGNWDWNDFDNAVEQAFSLSEHLPQRIDVIFDLTNSNRIADGAVVYLKKFMNVVPANRGHYVTVGTDPQLITIVEMFNRIFKKFNGHLSYSNSIDKTRAYLAYLQAESMRIAS